MDGKKLGVSRAKFAKALQAEGIIATNGYIPSCVYQYDMFKNKTVYPGEHTQYPFDGTHGHEISYRDGDCPVAEQIIDDCVKLAVNEFFTEQDLDQTVAAIEKVCAYYIAKAKGN